MENSLDSPDQEPPDFPTWFDQIFNNPGDRKWFWDDSREIWNETHNPALALDYVITLFEDPAFLAENYTLSQIDDGLYYIIWNGLSHYMLHVLDESLPWAQRRRCIASFVPLFEKLIAPVYGDLRGGVALTEESAGHYLNFTCFMWWDVIPLWEGTDISEYDDYVNTVFGVFEACLAMPSEACVESALHGLGHWYHGFPERVPNTVDAFLKHAQISESLREYARHARLGMVQ